MDCLIFVINFLNLYKPIKLRDKHNFNWVKRTRRDMESTSLSSNTSFGSPTYFILRRRNIRCS